MKIEILESFPPNSNPFHHNMELMGEYVGTNVALMFHNFTNEHQRFIDVIDKTTGQRIRIRFEEAESNHVTDEELEAIRSRNVYRHKYEHDILPQEIADIDALLAEVERLRQPAHMPELENS